MTRLRLPILICAAALFCAVQAQAGTARFTGFPSRQRLVTIAVPNPPAEPVAKLPPPIAPGMDKGEVEKQPPPSPSHVEADKTAEQLASERLKAEAAAEAQAEARRKQRIKAERERLNHNALVWQQERAAAGSATAKRSLAMRYLTGDGVEKDETKGMDLLRTAAKGGDSAAQKELAKREPAKKE